MPAVAEVLITLMMVAIGFAAFTQAAKHLPIFPEETEEEDLTEAAWMTAPPKAEAPHGERRSELETV